MKRIKSHLAAICARYSGRRNRAHGRALPARSARDAYRDVLAIEVTLAGDAASVMAQWGALRRCPGRRGCETSAHLPQLATSSRPEQPKKPSSVATTCAPSPTDAATCLSEPER